MIYNKLGTYKMKDEYNIKCRNCIHSNRLEPVKARKYFSCKKGVGIFPINASFKKCKHFKDYREEGKK